MKFAILVLSMFLLPMAASAGENLVVVGAGVFNALRTTDDSTEFRLEYSGRQQWNGFGTHAGVNGNTDGGAYVFGGFNYEYVFSNNLYVSPSIAVGHYTQGNSKRLGGPIEFRSQFETGYKFGYGGRIGAAISHISNAGIYDHNPGQESVVLLYAHPLN
jgi:hypothetical protein